ncbi:hypothetical protein GZH52_09230 [Crenobacter sp. HX-7-9]|uniref:Resolvase/invertase-type recombinase catalytic domain-containing protein n=1 Tax=Crenobacter caeni TaxID=2705474 RepID=A0A6B2KSC3_9NEIS|nr:hypothetical protein [Crenobacter caeni]
MFFHLFGALGQFERNRIRERPRACRNRRLRASAEVGASRR